ncbi:rhomboid family intramembrane serine protease [Asticcacaulis sp. 201]|uniref:rhomboid family intramembrane serine protease n=1 Tax=Asticcacaulis sp. 201 TaxID=3028787 RepID=UPI0029166C71|nr:rhomboid family intramembrane serine protease [Asticcacaulis sp. 201]MDV6332963.1 rhomboid family intramembrane serine protease [Asticcacaulis sp. 201]
MTDDALPPANEPAFNAPLMVIILPLLIIAVYAFQVWIGPEANALLVESFALTPILLRQGNFDLLFTHIFLHGSWTHVLFNASACLIFATPLVRAFGKGAGAALSFFALFLLCGVAAGLGYCVLNMRSNMPVVGASGAIYALIGASSRIVGVRGESGGVLPLMNQRVIMSALVWCGLNLATALLPYIPGVGNLTIAWQAHIAGYLFGLLIVGHWLKAFHPGFFTRN